MAHRFLEDPYWFLLAAVALDLALGDPVYPYHPVRLTGKLLKFFEARLFALGLDGRGGGVILFFLLSISLLVPYYLIDAGLSRLHWLAAALFRLYVAFSFLCFRDLISHGLRVAARVRANDLEGARRAASMLVGRDTDKMDLSACNRAAIESLTEGLVDGVLSPLLYLSLFGIPGLILFKIVSTMDSMVGFKTERYLKFGWFGARVDDVLNFIPARLAWLLVALSAAFMPGASALKALRVGWRQHGLFSSPNSGWPEAAVAGALQLRLVGPLWKDGQKVADVWVGDPGDREGARLEDVVKTVVLCCLVTAIYLAMVVWMSVIV